MFLYFKENNKTSTNISRNNYHKKLDIVRY